MAVRWSGWGAWALVVLGAPAMAQMAQAPLLAGGSSAASNFVFTIDDSGSMADECVPEPLCNSASFSVGSVWRISKAGAHDLFNIFPVSYNDSLLFAKQMRSAGTNPMYYDPAVRYMPWRKADGSFYPQYPAIRAPYHPLFPADTLNLSLTQMQTGLFCTSNTACAKGTESVFVAQYFNLAPGQDGSAPEHFTQVLINRSGLPKGPMRTDCLSTSTSCSLAEELQNFSNWFTYARNKMLAAKNVISSAFYRLPSELRLGYGRINQDQFVSVDGQPQRTLVRGIRPFNGVDKATFYDWLLQLNGDGSTPLRRAMGDVGEYYRRSDNAGPWGAQPGSNDASAHASCRRAFHLLVTDGGWANGAAYGASNAAATLDADKDGFPNTLADVAMYYWQTDLRPDLANQVKSISGDTATWQHMVNYTIGFGVSGRLNNPADLPALMAGTKSWGNPAANSLAKIDDLWHAAVNSRGRSLNVRDPLSFANALRAAMDDIAARSASDAGVLLRGNLKLVPLYQTSDWSGDLKAVTLDSQGGEIALSWSAASMLPESNLRAIYTFKDSASRGVALRWPDLQSAGLQALLGVSDADGPALINYLRGDGSLEGTRYRLRNRKLGDIVNASPSLVLDSLDMQYDLLPPSPGTAAPSYRSFLRNKAARTGQVFVGANDGMLHGFSLADGVETFAFMPRSVLGEVRKLALPDYVHQYFVDGPTAEADVFDTRQGLWRNLLIASSGAGAKNLFAVQVPVSTSANNGAPPSGAPLMAPQAGDILWEVSNQMADYAELGFVLSKPETGVLRDGTWAVISGNGYESSSGKAQLLVIDAMTGALLKRIDTGVGAGNGLGGVRVVRDRQRQIVAAYAGDLKGNVWKFDFSSNNPAQWGLAFGGKPLFEARNRQGQTEPITTAPGYRAHPLGGVTVLVGSGKLFESADASNTEERSLYGLWDSVPVGSNSGSASAAIASRAQLVEQTLSATTLVQADSSQPAQRFFSSSAKVVDYASARGWVMPLSLAAGQRLVYEPQLSLGSVYFKTVVPGAAAQDCTASNGGAISLLFDPFTGAPHPKTSSLDTNGDGKINMDDQPHFIGFNSAADGPDAFSPRRGSSAAEALLVSASGARVASGPKAQARRSWRQIVTPP